MDLSIVIVSWNTREILRDCLSSVFQNLSGLEAEVFVVDNQSSDGSAEMVAEDFPAVRLVRNARNVGFAAGNNQAIRMARGRFVLLLNSDTVILDDVLQRSIAYLDERPEVGVMGCRVLNADRSVQRTCFRFPTFLNLFLKTSGLFRLSWPRFLGREHMSDWGRDSERDVEVITGCYMLVRREALQEVGLLDEQFFFFGEETDWCTRFRRAGWQLRFAPVGEIVHLGGASCKQLNHRRDVLLTEGLVRLHRKHSGLGTAVAVWLLLGLFNVSRMAFWCIASPVARDFGVRRMRHFFRVSTNIQKTWPRKSSACEPQSQNA